MTASLDPSSDLIHYKTILAGIIDTRPSGIRRRLADALKKNPSFISQITNPNYATPIPPSDVPVIMEICHFSERDREEFLAAYRDAHPRRGQLLSRDAPALRQRQLVLQVPDFGNAEKNRAFDALLRDFATRIGRFGADE